MLPRVQKLYKTGHVAESYRVQCSCALDPSLTHKLEDSKACSEYTKYASKGYEIIDLLQDNILVKLHLK